MGVAIMMLFAAWSYAGNSPTSDGFLQFSLLSTAAAAVIGGYVTAMVAPYAAMRHVLGLVAFGLFITSLSLLTASGDASASYQVANAVVMVPGVLLGGYARAHFRRRAHA